MIYKFVREGYNFGMRNMHFWSDGVLHFVLRKHTRRKSRPTPRSVDGFDSLFYLAFYDDLRHLATAESIIDHYICYGEREGRYKNENEAILDIERHFGKIPADFDASIYESLHADLASAFKHPLQFAKHYVQYGREEGRAYKRHPNWLPPVSYFYTHSLLNPDGVVPSRRPANECDFALSVPFKFKSTRQWSDRPILVVVHCYYTDVFDNIFVKLANIPGRADLYISTDTDQKKEELLRYEAQWSKGSFEVRLLPNRGRDIAPKIVGFSDVYKNYELFLHLHTKRSPHGGSILAAWRDYLVDTLIGTEQIASSVLSLFDDEAVGIVFPQHLPELRGILNWGYDYEIARDLLAKLNVAIDKNLVLEFPSGSMFFGRTAAIRPLLDVGLTFDDFPEEAGQIDGTLAHAVERSMLMIAESAGFEWLKVARKDTYRFPDTVLEVKHKEDIAKHRLRVFIPCLARSHQSLIAQSLPQMSGIPSYPSRNKRPRINLIVPTVNPHQIYGGVATAIKIYQQICYACGKDFDRRIIVTDARIHEDAFSKFDMHESVPFCQTEDKEKHQIVDAFDRSAGRLNLRDGDIFIATAWWTAAQALNLLADQRRFFGKKLPFVYLIQDDEPYFYGWGTRFALAEATYRHEDETIAIINSEELYSEMTNKYSFSESFCYPYSMNETISESLSELPRERILLVYARPNTDRNAFDLICDALYSWQQKDPIIATKWSIFCVGEKFEPGLIYPVHNVSIKGKVSLPEYADFLSRASVGLSLMLSPHPSYPPLEMAEAGLVTITNSYGAKDLRGRFEGILSIDRVDSATLTQAIETAINCAEATVGNLVQRRKMRPPAIRKGRRFDADRVASLLRDEVSCRDHSDYE